MNIGKRLLIEKLLRRQVRISKIQGTNIYIYRYKEKELFNIGSYSDLLPYNIGLMLSNKNYVSEILLKNKLPVAKGKLFMPDQENEAMDYADKIGFPIFIRQENSQIEEKGKTIEHRENFRAVFQVLAKLQECILVEKYFQGDEYRILYTDNGYLNCLKKIAGGSDDLTKEVHHSVRNMSIKVINCFPGWKFISFRLLCQNILRKLASSNCIITDVYPSWGDNINYNMTGEKDSKSASSVISDLMFPGNARK